MMVNYLMQNMTTFYTIKLHNITLDNVFYKDYSIVEIRKNK